MDYTSFTVDLPLFKKTCIIVAGPTAVGKTGIALRLAQDLQTSIISADSRQCYRELTIGVAKPAPEELDLVKHYFIDSHSVTDEVNAGVFEQYALAAAYETFQSRDTVLMAGGTGLYIRAFCEGMDAMPAIDSAVRHAITEAYRTGGLFWLQNQLREKDPDWYRTGDIQNPQRMMRALEVIEATGRSILQFQTAAKANRGFNIIKIGLDLPRPQLYEQINQRVDKMISSGLEDEVRALEPWRSLNALQTVGYTEILDYIIDGKTDLATAVDLIKRNTRHYAKRQLTWLRKDASFAWFSPVDYRQLTKFLHNLV